jgi:hypothetical protein
MVKKIRVVLGSTDEPNGVWVDGARLAGVRTVFLHHDAAAGEPPTVGITLIAKEVEVTTLADPSVTYAKVR